MNKEKQPGGYFDIKEWLNSFKVKKRLGEENTTVFSVEIPEINPKALRKTLEGYGAKFNPEAKGYDSLSQPTNRHRRRGMDTVWGEEFMDRYNLWTEKWAKAYEKTGRKLPKLEKSKSKTSGMKHFLGLLTAYAAEKITYEKFKEQMEARILNGYTYAKGLGKSSFNILPEGKSLPASIPPYFIKSALEVIESGVLHREVPEIILSKELVSNNSDPLIR